jgi:transposase
LFFYSPDRKGEHPQAHLKDFRGVIHADGGACPRAGQRPDPGAGLTGSPDESGAKRREQGLAKAGNARVRRGMIQLAWRFLRFQHQSALAQWYRARTADSRLGTRKTMIVALARKLLIALWRFVTTGETLDGVILRPAG